jgi:hypothetical protein
MMVQAIWGVDSAEKVTKRLYDCTLQHFGKPEYWGRYLTTVPNASDGLTKEEILLLHNSGTRVLPIYNNFRDATGYQAGKIIAQNAVFHAKRLGFPKGKVLFANVERFFKVDEAWIRGYVDAMYPSGYKPGFYHDPVKGTFTGAYCAAAKTNDKVSVQSILWSAEPEYGATKKRDAPAYQPAKVSCPGNVWGWQYGRDAAQCPIDTNLIEQRLFEMLW